MEDSPIRATSRDNSRDTMMKVYPTTPGEAAKPKNGLSEDVIIHDCFLLLDRKSRGFLEESDIPEAGLNIVDKIGGTKSLRALLKPTFIQQNNKEIVPEDRFKNVLKGYDLEPLWRRLYAQNFRRIPEFLRRKLLSIRYREAKLSLEDEEGPQKDLIMAVWNLVSTYREALDHISDIVLLFLIYHYGLKPQNLYKIDYTIVFVVKLLAITSNYLIAYSSGVQLLLHKGVFDPENWKKHHWVKKSLLSLSFTFISPLYFVLLTLLDMAITMLKTLAVIFVPKKRGFGRITEFLEGLIRRMGLSSQEFNGLVEQKSMVQLMFQNLPVLVIDTLILTKVVNCPELLKESLNGLLLSYGLTIFNLISQVITLKMNANYLKEDFLSYCLISMKAKFGWIPYIGKLEDQALTENIVDYHQIQCPIPFITPLIGIYTKISFEFSELTIRQLISTVGRIKTKGQKENGAVQEIKIGRIVSNVSIQVLVQLLSAKPSYLILNLEGINWKERVEFSKKTGSIPNQKKWEAVTPLQENMLSFCVDSEEDDSFEYAELLEALLEGGADPDTKDVYGSPVLIHAIQKGKTRSVNLLLKYGANPNITFNEGSSCGLLMAFESYNWSAAEKLLKWKADVHAKISYKGEDITVLQKLLVDASGVSILYPWSHYAKAFSILSEDCRAETKEEKDAAVFIVAKYAHHLHSSVEAQEIVQGLKKILNQGRDLFFHQDKTGKTFLHHYMLGLHEDSGGKIFSEIKDVSTFFGQLQEQKDNEGNRPVDYFFLNYIPIDNAKENFVFNNCTLDWTNDTKLVDNLKIWITNLLRAKVFKFLKQHMDLLKTSANSRGAPKIEDLLDQIFKKEKKLGSDNETAEFLKNTYGYTIPGRLPQLKHDKNSQPIVSENKRTAQADSSNVTFLLRISKEPM